MKWLCLHLVSFLFFFLLISSVRGSDRAFLFFLKKNFNVNDLLSVENVLSKTQHKICFLLFFFKLCHFFAQFRDHTFL